MNDHLRKWLYFVSSTEIVGFNYLIGLKFRSSLCGFFKKSLAYVKEIYSELILWRSLSQKHYYRVVN